MDLTNRHRKLNADFMWDMMNIPRLKGLLVYWEKNKKELALEIRNNYLELYSLGHAIKIKQDKGRKYSMIGSKVFDPTNEIENPRLRDLVRSYNKNYWQVRLDDAFDDSYVEPLMIAIIARIVRHKKGSISEGVSEMNHLFDNRDAGKNGIMVIDRQVVLPNKRNRIDLLGIRRLRELEEKWAFSVIELKNKNNTKIGGVFTQLRDYIDQLYAGYGEFVETYERLIKQKQELGLIRGKRIVFGELHSKRQIKGLVVLDNYNIKSDFKSNGLLKRALDDWAQNITDEYDLGLMLKTNVLDSSFFIGLEQAKESLRRFRGGAA